MRQIVVGLAVLAFAIASPSLYAQEGNHGVAGIYGDYFRLNATGTDYLGIGGRVGFNVAPRVQLEGQMTYDFEQSFTTITATPISTFVQRSNVTLLHGLFGPKFVLGTEHARLFGTVQGGFLRFGVNNGSTGSSFVTSVNGFGDTNTNGALYPGGGGEFYVGPIGIRVDVGDLIYWNGGANHNLVLKFGPQIKF
jgi:hypothetical protein